MPQILYYKIKGAVAVLAGGIVASGVIAAEFPEFVGVFLGIGTAALIDVIFRLLNHTHQEPWTDAEAGASVWEMPLWQVCIAVSIFVAVLYSGVLK